MHKYMWKIVDLAGFAHYINKTIIIYKYKNLLDNKILFIVEENEFLYNPNFYIISDIDNYRNSSFEGISK